MTEKDGGHVMKTTFKRVVSIIVIICLTLTMMPGMAWTSYAETEEPYDYESSVSFDGMTQKLLPNGSSVMAYTSLKAYYEWGTDYPAYTLDVTLTPDGEESEDLITYTVEDGVITFTSNDRGECGWMTLKIDFIVNGNVVGGTETDISVTDTIYRWPNYISYFNPDLSSNPFVGEVINFDDITVEKYTYDEATGEDSFETITAQTEGVKFAQSDDGGWNPAGHLLLLRSGQNLLRSG